MKTTTNKLTIPAQTEKVFDKICAEYGGKHKVQALLDEYCNLVEKALAEATPKPPYRERDCLYAYSIRDSFSREYWLSDFAICPTDELLFLVTTAKAAIETLPAMKYEIICDENIAVHLMNAIYRLLHQYCFLRKVAEHEAIPLVK